MSKLRSDTGGRSTVWLSLWRAVQEIHEAQQRLWLINHPWEERVLHWSTDGERAVLHGEFASAGSPGRGVTSSGWCLGQSRQRPDVAHTR